MQRDPGRGFATSREHTDFDDVIVPRGQGYTAQVLCAPADLASAPFTLPFAAAGLAQFTIAVGPPGSPHVASFRPGPESTTSGSTATTGCRSLTLSRETPVVRVLDSIEPLSELAVQLPLKVLVMISSPSDLPALAVERERQLLVATIGGDDETAQEGVLALETAQGTVDRVSGDRLGTFLHDAQGMQLAVLNAFSGVGQNLVRQGLPAVVAMRNGSSSPGLGPESLRRRRSRPG